MAPAYAGHYVLVDRDGYAVAPDGTPLRTDELGAALGSAMQAGLDAHVAMLGRDRLASCPPVLRVLVFVHGGLNGYQAGFQHMVDLMGRGQVLDTTCYYPIFVDWNSAGLSAVWDDLVRIRFGEPRPWWVTVPTAPFVLLGRLLESVGSLPVSVGHNVTNSVEALEGGLAEGDSGASVAWDAVVHALLQPVHVLTTPILESFGRPAWQIMKRRAQLTTAGRLSEHALEGVNEGAARTLVRALKGLTRPGADGQAVWVSPVMGRPVPVEVTLVGHSMGAIVLNRLLTLSEDQVAGQPGAPLFVRHVVYLAPAASVDDFEELLLPYLRRHADTTFWVFTLNRRDEAREGSGLILLLPRGSLLAWIDSFFEPETTTGQATVGRVRNLGQYLGLPEMPHVVTPPPPAPTLLNAFREVPILTPLPEREYQFRAYQSPRTLGETDRPAQHADFTQPRFVKQVLCRVDADAFQDPKTCAGPLGASP